MQSGIEKIECKKIYGLDIQGEEAEMVHHFSEAEKMFHDEVRQKKRTASGVHHKTGKNGYVGTMRFPSDIMNRKDKMRYRKAGKVVTTNIFDTIITIDEFETLETYEQRNRLMYWRNEKTNKEILAGLGISSKKYYEIVAQLELPKAPRGKSKPRKATAKKQEPKFVAIKEETIVPEIQEPKPQVQEIIVEGLNLVFQGTYNAEIIQKQLTKFSLILEDEPDEYFFEFRLMQKQKQPN
jgi:hypothetical protein